MPVVYRIGRGLLALQLVGLVLIAPLAAFVAAVGAWMLFAEMPDLGVVGRLALAVFLLACAAAIGGAALLVLQNFRAFRRLRLEIHEDRLEATLPAWSGMAPRPPASTTFHPWRELAALEWREEIYRGFLMPAVYESWTLVARDGTRRRIGQSNAMSMPLPFAEISAALAARGVPTVDAPPLDHGGMWRPMFGREPAKSEPVAPAIVARKRRVIPVVMQLVAVLTTLAAILRACAS